MSPLDLQRGERSEELPELRKCRVLRVLPLSLLRSRAWPESETKVMASSRRVRDLQQPLVCEELEATWTYTGQEAFLIHEACNLFKALRFS